MAAVDDIEAMNLQSADGKAIKVRKEGGRKGRRGKAKGAGASCHVVSLASLGRSSFLETGSPVSSPCAATGSAGLVAPLPSVSAAWKSMLGIQRALDRWDVASFS